MRIIGTLTKLGPQPERSKRQSREALSCQGFCPKGSLPHRLCLAHACQFPACLLGVLLNGIQAMLESQRNFPGNQVTSGTEQLTFTEGWYKLFLNFARFPANLPELTFRERIEKNQKSAQAHFDEQGTGGSSEN